MNETNTAQSRLGFLDFLRGIAALAVCFEHAGYRLWPHFRELTHNYFSFGKFGLTAFFLTSGFVIPYSLERSNSLRRFWVNRFFRLYPLYWFSIAVAVTLFYCGVAEAVDELFPPHLIRNLFINLTMFQGFFGIPNVITLYYTLAMEMAFYIAFSVLFFKGLNRRSLSIAWLASGLLFVLAVFVPLSMHRRVPLAGLFYVVCLAVGTVIYRTFTGEASNRSLAALLGFLTFGTPIEIYCNYVFIKKADLLEQYTLLAVFCSWSAAYVVFLALYALRTYRFPKAFVWLGLISYSVYLLHPPLEAVIPVWQNPIYSLAAMLALTLAVSACTYRFIEQPGIALGKRVYNHIQAAGDKPRAQTAVDLDASRSRLPANPSKLTMAKAAEGK
jgi:peptidoglycan/LPS O-acetylase OafA/YrhL